MAPVCKKVTKFRRSEEKNAFFVIISLWTIKTSLHHFLFAVYRCAVPVYSFNKRDFIIEKQLPRRIMKYDNCLSPLLICCSIIAPFLNSWHSASYDKVDGLYASNPMVKSL